MLFSPAHAPHPYFAEHGWVAGPGEIVKAAGTEYTMADRAANQRLTPEQPLQLTWDNGEGLTFARTISVDENYMFTVSDEVENKTGKDVVLFPYARIYRYGTPKIEGFFIQHEGLIGFLGDAEAAEVTYADARRRAATRNSRTSIGGWVGFTDKYWAAALIPDQKTPYLANMVAKDKTDDRPTSISRPTTCCQPCTVPPGGSQKVRAAAVCRRQEGQPHRRLRGTDAASTSSTT